MSLFNRRPEEPPAFIYSGNPDTDTLVTCQLEEPCKACHTTGEATAPEWQDFSVAWDQERVWERSQAEIDEWDRQHPRPTVNETIPCPECEGAGWRLTVAGKAIMAFVRRHTK